jgi:hypothetical protein
VEEARSEADKKKNLFFVISECILCKSPLAVEDQFVVGLPAQNMVAFPTVLCSPVSSPAFQPFASV